MMHRAQTKNAPKRDLTSEILDPSRTNLGSLGAALAAAARELDAKRLAHLEN